MLRLGTVPPEGVGVPSAAEDRLCRVPRTSAIRAPNALLPTRIVQTSASTISCNLYCNLFFFIFLPPTQKLKQRHAAIEHVCYKYSIVCINPHAGWQIKLANVVSGAADWN